jgi:hypothetical protein
MRDARGEGRRGTGGFEDVRLKFSHARPSPSTFANETGNPRIRHPKTILLTMHHHHHLRNDDDGQTKFVTKK